MNFFVFLQMIGPQPPFRQNRQKIAAIVENFLLDILPDVCYNNYSEREKER